MYMHSLAPNFKLVFVASYSALDFLERHQLSQKPQAYAGSGFGVFIGFAYFRADNSLVTLQKAGANTLAQHWLHVLYLPRVCVSFFMMTDLTLCTC